MKGTINFLESSDNTATITIIKIIGGLIVGIILFYLNRFYKKRDAKKVIEAKKVVAIDKELSEARKEIISAFGEALKRLNFNDKIPSAILKEGGTMSSHKVVYDIFRSIVERLEGSEAVSGLDKVWNDYYSGETPYAKYHSTRFKGVDEKAKNEAARNEAIKRIKAILDFVDQL